MSQRSQSIEQEFDVVLRLKVVLKSLSNHNGFKDGQVESAVEEFKESIADELLAKIQGEHFGGEFLQSVDFVNYEVY